MKEWFKNLSPTAQLIIVVVILIIVYYAAKAGQSFFRGLAAKSQSIGEVAALNAQGVQRTYTDSQYKTFASKLFTAMSGAGTDEDAIYAVYRKMENDVDIIHLNNAFGDKDGYDLSEWLYDDLNTVEIEKVNKILLDKGISKTY
jgi:hypothetical protein